MTLKIHNSISGKLENFEPLEPGLVRMYVCGVTVYDSSHVGHARAAVVFDVIYRYLIYKGYKVNYVRNFTDIDDKIINRSEKEGIRCEELTKRYIEEYTAEMKKLNVLKPVHEPKATEHIPEMISVISKLIDKKHAYTSGGDVFFHVESFPGYGKLSKKSLTELKAGSRVDIDERKLNPFDFVLWKASKPGEPSWPSPWGAGRPGWHIECSAMSMKYLGKTIDIHGGGQDLIFPHHENEIAQSECANLKPFVRFWIHNAFVTINKEKMSKSLGNIFILKDLFLKWNPKTVRFFLIAKHYRSPIDFNPDSLDDAGRALARVENALALFEEIAGVLPQSTSASENQEKNIMVLFEQAMDDDFNTSLALGELFACVGKLNAACERKKADDESIGIYRAARKILEVLGLCVETKSLLNRVEDDTQAAQIPLMTKDAEYHIIHFTENPASREAASVLVQLRNIARKEKNWGLADKIRNTLLNHGIEIRDEKESTIWIKK